jgi:hypothetical protein
MIVILNLNISTPSLSDISWDKAYGIPDIIGIAFH